MFWTIFDGDFHENTTIPYVWIFILYRVFSFYFIVIWKYEILNLHLNIDAIIS